MKFQKCLLSQWHLHTLSVIANLNNSRCHHCGSKWSMSNIKYSCVGLVFSFSASTINTFAIKCGVTNSYVDGSHWNKSLYPLPDQHIRLITEIKSHGTVKVLKNHLANNQLYCGSFVFPSGKSLVSWASSLFKKVNRINKPCPVLVYMLYKPIMLL